MLSSRLIRMLLESYVLSVNVIFAFPFAFFAYLTYDNEPMLNLLFAEEQSSNNENQQRTFKVGDESALQNKIHF